MNKRQKKRMLSHRDRCPVCSALIIFATIDIEKWYYVAFRCMNDHEFERKGRRFIRRK